VTNREYRE